MTLKNGIETAMLKAISEIRAVEAVSQHTVTIGILRPMPNAFGETLSTGGVWILLYSVVFTIFKTLLTTASLNPSRINSLRTFPLFYILREDPVEDIVRRKGIRVSCPGRSSAEGGFRSRSRNNLFFTGR